MMQDNFKFKKIGAYLGILSISCPNIVVAMRPEQGLLVAHARRTLQIIGHPQPLPVVPDIESLSYEDFDITAHLSSMPFLRGIVWPSERQKIRSLHLDTNIPYINVPNPAVDYDSLRAVPFFMAIFLCDKIHPSKRAGALEFLEGTVISNQQALSPATTAIPDTDCLYYKSVSGVQHLFLRLSSATRKEAELFKQRASGNSLFNECGEIKLLSDGSIILDHMNAEADQITVDAKDTIFNRASKIKAKWVIRLKAGKQRNETVINKWVRESSGAHHFAHAEGVESVDDCLFVAQEVIQEGDEVENYGIFVEADKFEDRATHTVNMPAKITLVNYAWEEDEGLFSSAYSSVRQVDDVLVPTRYHVNYYRSASDKEVSSVKFGYTVINSGSKIEVLKDVKEDVVVDEQHTIEIHEETSGFSICGGISVPDPTTHLQKLRAMHKAGNMVGLTTAAISAVANGIQAYEDYKDIKALAQHEGDWTAAETQALLQTLSHYVHGPSIQFGSRSVDMTQQTTVTHGNTFVAPTQIFHNSVRSSFAGTYIAQDMDIRTKTFVTFDLPQTTYSKTSVHQSGISIDLLSFAIALVNPAGPMLNAAMKGALAASSITCSVQEGESYQQLHRPTVLQADQLNIEAENGHLTQAQIKAGIIHAVFSEDLVLETLANERWERKKGGGFSFGLGAFADFKTLATTLRKAVASANITHIDSGHFEKIIDGFASMVGEEEFYVRVGGILQTKSAFLGHATHDPAREHIEARQRIDSQVEEYSRSYDHSFELPIGALLTVLDAVKQQIFDEALAQNLPTEEAVKSVTECTQLLEDTANSVKSAQEVMKQIDSNCQAKMAEKLIEVADEAPIDAKCEAQQVNLTAIVDSILEAADQKIEILNQKIAEIEAQKAAVAESARHSPGAQETLNTVLDSCLDLLKSTREHCVNAIENPTETIALVYSVAKALGEAAMDKTGEMVKFVYENPWGALDSVKGKLSDIYQAVHDDIIGAGLDAAEYAPGGIGSFVEGARDVQGVWITRDRDLRAVTDKWRNYGIFAIIGGKGARKVAKNVFDIVADVSKKDALRNATVLQAQRKIGNVGRYGELTRNVEGKGFYDRKQAHHIPSKSFMAKYGIKEKDGLAIIMTNEQHAKTRTFKGKAKNIPADATARDELARDLWDVRRIMKEDGTYTKEVNRNLMEGVKDFKEKFSHVFQKEKK